MLVQLMNFGSVSSFAVSACARFIMPLTSISAVASREYRSVCDKWNGCDFMGSVSRRRKKEESHAAWSVNQSVRMRTA
jgi:hypothetical protein